ncbi:MAG: malonic semialdehyde reductase [Alphaproteobacteria bacterium]
MSAEKITSDTTKIINDQAMDILFRNARTYNHWQKKPVSDVTLKALYDLMKWAPTSANCSPLRVKFVQSEEQKQKLKPFLDAGNVDKTMSAPVTAILACDMKFYDHLPKLFPHTDARSWFAGNDALIKATAMRNGTLQGAYMILAARAVGLDCGAMSGFNADGVKQAFFGDEDVVVDLLCNLGYGDDTGMFPRSPRFEFDDVCEII